MRQETITYYEFSELSENAQKKAIEYYRDKFANKDPFWQEEIFDSLRALFDHLPGIKLKNYELGAYCYSYIELDFRECAVAHLSHGRAMAWLENNLLSQLRIPFTGRGRWENARYGYRAGTIPDCPLTGVCFDDSYLESLTSDVRQGMSLKDALCGLADVYRKLLEAEYEHQSSEKYIRETLAGEFSFEFTEDGKLL